MAGELRGSWRGEGEGDSGEPYLDILPVPPVTAHQGYLLAPSPPLMPPLMPPYYQYSYQPSPRFVQISVRKGKLDSSLSGGGNVGSTTCSPVTFRETARTSLNKLMEVEWSASPGMWHVWSLIMHVRKEKTGISPNVL